MSNQRPEWTEYPLSGQSVLDQLINILDLETVEVDIFRGVSPRTSLQRVFGGQVAGQAVVAAGRTVPSDRTVHSLHAYFLRPGDPEVPIVYTVDRLRDGRSFTTRRVVAIQHGKVIFNLTASFHRQESGLEHATPIPDVPAPETLPTLTERFDPYRKELGMWAELPRPIDLRYVDDPPWVQRAQGARAPISRVWLRTDGQLPNDPLLHVCALTYASDMTLLESVLVGHGMSWEMDEFAAASLDHAMWFHRPFQADEWLLYESRSSSASDGRVLAEGRFWTRDGSHVATVVQEGLIRLGKPPA